MKPTKKRSSLLTAAQTRPVLFTALAVVLVFLAIWTKGFFGPTTLESSYYEVKRSDFLVTIIEGGTLEALREVVIRNEVEGREARIIYIVPEGTYVKKGDLLVELDTGEALERFNQQELSYEKAKSAFIQAEQGLEIQKSIIQSGIDRATLDVEFAEIDLKKYEQADREIEIMNIEAQIVTLKSEQEYQKNELYWSERLFEKNFETKNAVEKNKNNLQKLNLDLKTAETNLWALREFKIKKNTRELESALEQAKKALEREISQGESKLAQLRADLITQSNSLELTRTRLELDRKQLDKSKIEAPQDGLVVYATMQSRFSSQSLIEEGAMVRNQQPLIKLPDTSAMKVTIKVHESHVAKVHPGQPAYVVLDPLPDQRFKAQVIKVGVLPNAQDRFGNPDLKVYDTEVLIQDPLPGIKPGISARAELIITNVPNAITVPIQAVTSLKGRTVAFVKKGLGSEPVPVEVGMFNTKYIEVTSSLSEGDLVLLSPPYDAQQQDMAGGIIRQDEVVDAKALESSMPAVVAPKSGNPPNNDGAPGAAENPQGQGGGGRGGMDRETMMKRFDTNGDGEIDATERAAIQKQFGGGRGGAGGGGGGGQRGGGQRGGGGGGAGGRAPGGAQQ